MATKKFILLYIIGWLCFMVILIGAIHFFPVQSGIVIFSVLIVCIIALFFYWSIFSAHGSNSYDNSNSNDKVVYIKGNRYVKRETYVKEDSQEEYDKDYQDEEYN